MNSPVRARSATAVAASSTRDILRIASHKEWLSSTSATGWRGKELGAIDKAVLSYQLAVTAYAQDWYSNDIRIAFDQWKKAEGAKWREHTRNKSGAFDRLAAELAIRFPHPVVVRQDAEVAATLRRNVVYWLSACTVAGMPATAGSILNDATDLGSDMHELVDSVRGAGSASVGNIVHGRQGPDTSDGFLKKLADVIVEYLKKLPGALLDYGADAVGYISQQLPGLLKAALGGLLQNLSAAKEILGGLVQAGRAAVAVYSSRDMAIAGGNPKLIVESVRDQIKDKGWEGIETAVKQTLITAVGVANPIAGSICGVLASIYEFVTGIYTRLKDRAKMAALIAFAKLEIKKPAGTAIHTRPDAFQDWFVAALADLPILSAYCMSMPYTGSYFGFLTLVGTDGTEMSTQQLERSYGIFNDVKRWAREFVRQDHLKLRSEDLMIQHSLTVARNDGVAAECSATLKSRIKSTAIGVVEAVAG
nr:hypothetical protein [uncultured Duganella sp.]